MEPYLSNPLFETAVDALIAGDAPALKAMLRQDPGLIRARSTRPHHATLLHYIGTNGVEDERQKYPPNAVEMLKLLLAAGAEVDAEADLYGGGATTFGLVATSVHPVKSGVLIPLLETLLEAGASIEHPGAGGNGQRAVNACLHNGRPEAADFLVRKGVTLDLEAAAGTGRLDVVKTFFNEDGRLTGGATRTQMEYGFGWACEYGHIAVVEYLLGRGADPNKLVNGLSGLHWAILGAHIDTIQLLIRRGADLMRRIYTGAMHWARLDGQPGIAILRIAGRRGGWIMKRSSGWFGRLADGRNLPGTFPDFNISENFRIWEKTLYLIYETKRRSLKFKTQMMKAYFLKATGMAVLTLLLHTSGFAQDQGDDDKDTGRLGGQDEIVIKHKGDKDAKVVIEIKGNQVYINGKPANDYSDDNISVQKKKELMLDGQAFSWSGDGQFPGGITIAPSPFRKHGGTMSMGGHIWNSNRAFLGVTTEPVNKEGEKGAEIREISKGSAASKANLKVGDIITRVDEINVDGPQSLADAVHKYKPEDKITLTFKRDGKEQKMTITLGKAPGAPLGSLYNMPPMPDMPNLNFNDGGDMYPPGAPHVYNYSFGARPRLGIKAQDTEEGKGVKVLEVGDESAAEKAGIQEGDIITKFDGKEVNSATELAELAHAGKDKPSIKVSILRGGKTQDIEIRIPKKLKTADL